MRQAGQALSCGCNIEQSDRVQIGHDGRCAGGNCGGAASQAAGVLVTCTCAPRTSGVGAGMGGVAQRSGCRGANSSSSWERAADIWGQDARLSSAGRGVAEELCAFAQPVQLPLGRLQGQDGARHKVRGPAQLVEEVESLAIAAPRLLVVPLRVLQL